MIASFQADVFRPQHVTFPATVGQTDLMAMACWHCQMADKRERTEPFSIGCDISKDAQYQLAKQRLLDEDV